MVLEDCGSGTMNQGRFPSSFPTELSCYVVRRTSVSWEIVVDVQFME